MLRGGSRCSCRGGRAWFATTNILDQKCSEYHILPSPADKTVIIVSDVRRASKGNRVLLSRPHVAPRRLDQDHDPVLRRYRHLAAELFAWQARTCDPRDCRAA